MRRVYARRRAVVAVCAVLVLLLAGLSAHAAMGGWSRGTAPRNQSDIAAQTVAQTPFSTIDPVVERDNVPQPNQAIQEQRDQEAARARWTNPTGSQPDLSQYSNLSVDVNLAEQKVYVKSNGETIYTMIASSGMNDATPRGNYVIQQRGTHFYNASEGMGADYWVRFRGSYLFHSVPTGPEAGDYIASEGEKLGQPASHGCVRLTVADAQWFYNQIPEGTPVTIA
ncbi:L,D-transpeptidase [Bifidobacterium saguini]|nr:L,D-transpeptidase [Bifidobacterium saguini]